MIFGNNLYCNIGFR